MYVMEKVMIGDLIGGEKRISHTGKLILICTSSIPSRVCPSILFSSQAVRCVYPVNIFRRSCSVTGTSTASHHVPNIPCFSQFGSHVLLFFVSSCTLQEWTMIMIFSLSTLFDVWNFIHCPLFLYLDYYYFLKSPNLYI